MGMLYVCLFVFYVTATTEIYTYVHTLSLPDTRPGFARAWWGSVDPLRRGIEVEGLEHIAAARAGGRGVIVVSGHFTTLEVCGRLMCGHVPLAGMYRPHAQPAMEWAVRRGRRSEEHTSELQSLMRISYAVFCLNKKKTKTIKTQITP